LQKQAQTRWHKTYCIPSKFRRVGIWTQDTGVGRFILPGGSEDSLSPIPLWQLLKSLCVIHLIDVSEYLLLFLQGHSNLIWSHFDLIISAKILWSVKS
jgi:hypothetical protein